MQGGNDGAIGGQENRTPRRHTFSGGTTKEQSLLMVRINRQIATLKDDLALFVELCQGVEDGRVASASLKLLEEDYKRMTVAGEKVNAVIDEMMESAQGQRELNEARRLRNQLQLQVMDKLREKWGKNQSHLNKDTTTAKKKKKKKKNKKKKKKKKKKTTGGWPSRDRSGFSTSRRI